MNEQEKRALFFQKTGRIATVEQTEYQAFIFGLQAGAVSRDAEVVSLTNQRDYEYVRAENAEQERDQLRAEINVLREALQFLIATKELKESVGKTPEYEQMRIIAWGKATVAITSTPEQSLAEFKNKTIEECAKRAEAHAYMSQNFNALAEELRAMKELQ